MSLEVLAEHRCFDGVQGRYRHVSEVTGSEMYVSVYQPPAAAHDRAPVLYFLAGLTCSDENFTIKAGAQRYAAEHGLILVSPDTSPRGVGLPREDESYDFGTGAGFYLDATVEPWSRHYRMYTYITEELPALIAEHFAADTNRQGIFGHSMGGHGALVCALRNPDRYRSVSAFSPICAPMQCPWGQKAFDGYLGSDRAAWRNYDATELIADSGWQGPILVDQGTLDPYLERELKPELLRAACAARGMPLTLNLRDRYDHSYYFVASFVGDHVLYHARALAR